MAPHQREASLAPIASNYRITAAALCLNLREALRLSGDVRGKGELESMLRAPIRAWVTGC